MMHASTFGRACFICVFPVLVGAILGCGGGSKTATISGKVTYKNQPLPGGAILFFSDTEIKGSKKFIGEINDDGTYSITGVPFGPATVAIDTEMLKRMLKEMMQMPEIPKDPKALELMKQNPQFAEQMAKMKAQQNKKYTPLPAKYADAKTSGFSLEVKENTHTDVNFDLK